MRVLPLAVVLLGIVAIPGVADAARDWWEGAGPGEAQESGSGDCSAIYQVGLTREAQYSWYVHIEIYAYPNRGEIAGCLPRGYVFPNVTGGPNTGWRSTVVSPCATSWLEIGSIGAVPAGVADLEFYFGDFCNGHVERGFAIVAFMTPDA